MLYTEVTEFKSTPPRGTGALEKRCLLLGVEGQVFVRGAKAAAPFRSADQYTPSLLLPQSPRQTLILPVLSASEGHWPANNNRGTGFAPVPLLIAAT